MCRFVNDCGIFVTIITAFPTKKAPQNVTFLGAFIDFFEWRIIAPLSLMATATASRPMITRLEFPFAVWLMRLSAQHTVTGKYATATIKAS